MSEPAIRIEGLWKRYGLPFLPFLRRWLDRLLGPQVERWALREIDLEVRRGEILGVIGRNGAGKSTLLKVLAGVSPATRGRVSVAGRIFPMIELNAGLHAELTGRENSRLLGAVMGLSRRVIESRLGAIAEFTELGDWFDQPVRTYSSGMLARLGFAVAMNVDCEVLLVDEVLSVGDLSFQRRCYDRFAELHRSGATLLFVSHAIRQIERLCDRAILLHEGRLELAGEAAEVVTCYLERSTEVEHDLTQGAVSGTGEVSLRAVRLYDAAGQETVDLLFGKPFSIEVEVVAHERLPRPNLAISIISSDWLRITNVSTDNVRERPDWVGAGCVRCDVHDLPLLPGTYFIMINVRREDGLQCLIVTRARQFRVLPEGGELFRGCLGVVYTPVSWSYPGQ